MIRIIYIQALLVLFVTVINAQVADSFYNQGCKYYNANEKELAKKCLLTFINRQMTHQDSTEMSSILGYAYYMNLSYDLLKMIFFEEKDYENALVYNEKQHSRRSLWKNWGKQLCLNGESFMIQVMLKI
jgi:hypothetical protein